MGTRSHLGAVVVLALAGIAACGDGGEPDESPTLTEGMKVGGFNFAESELLAEMYAQVIESTGTPVVRLGPIGPREIVAPALEQGLVDIVPEYLGTALRRAGSSTPDPDPESALANLVRLLEPVGLTALEAAAAENKNVFAITSELAAQKGLSALSDLAPFASEMRIGGPPECADRPLCVVGLEEVYGLRFAEFVSQSDNRFTAEALRRAEIDVGVMFSTDSALVTFDLFVLDDDRALQPAENIVPVLRIDALDRWGSGVVDALNALADRLTTRELRILNVRVDNEESIEAVARDWLTTQRLLGQI